MVAFTIRVLFVSSDELSPQRSVSITFKSFLPKMFLSMFFIIFRKVNFIEKIRTMEKEMS